MENGRRDEKVKDDDHPLLLERNAWEWLRTLVKRVCSRFGLLVSRLCVALSSLLYSGQAM